MFSFLTVMGLFHNSVVHGQEPLLKAVEFFKFYFLLLTETALEDLWTSCLGLAKWWHSQLIEP